MRSLCLIFGLMKMCNGGLIKEGRLNNQHNCNTFDRCRSDSVDRHKSLEMLSNMTTRYASITTQVCYNLKTFPG